MDNLSLFQTVAYWLAPTRIYDRPPAVARRNRGFRLISVSHEIIPTRLGRRLGFPHLADTYEGSARSWNSIQSGEAVTDEKHIDWLERIWLAAIGAEPAPDLRLERRPKIAASDRHPS